MKLSVEAKVAAFLAAGFLALTMGVIAQGNSEDQSMLPNGYGRTSNPGVSALVSQHAHSSSAGRTDAEENRDRTQLQLRE